MEEILQDIEKIQKITKEESQHHGSFNTFWKKFFLFVQDKIHNHYAADLALYFWLFCVSIIIGEMVVWTERMWIFSILAWFVFAFFVLRKIDSRSDHDIIREKRLEKFRRFLLRINIIPQDIHKHNKILKRNLQNYDINKFISISDEILKISKKLALFRYFLPFFYSKQYIRNLNFIIYSEIFLLEKIISYIFENQILHHEKIISDISHLQNNSEEDYRDILELQKIRLEKQKEIFEKFLLKKS